MNPRSNDRAGAPPRRVGAHVAFVGVAKSYGTVQALKPTSLEIASGEFFAILGPSGSGKSTLLGIAAGYLTPSAGRMLLNGQDALGSPPYRRNVGMVFQNYALFPHMTVAENVSFPLRMRGLSKAAIAGRVQEMLAMVRLTGFQNRRPSELSGGQQQRVALARAAIYDPLLLLMDEPLGALDKNLRETVQDEVKRFQQALGATVIYVTHDQQEAAAMADRIAIMRGGQIVQIGTSKELYERPQDLFVASFLGEANVIAVEAADTEGAHGTSIRTAGGLILKSQDQSAISGKKVACIRPERIFALGSNETLDNRFEAVVCDVAYAIGSYRYRLRLPDGTVIAWRPPAGEPIKSQVGDSISIGWHARDTLVFAADSW